MLGKKAQIGDGSGGSLWPVLSVLLVAVLIPSAAVLWFMSHVVRNEHLAVRQKLAEVYAEPLDNIQALIQDHWRQKADALSEAGPDESAGMTFARLVESGVCDSVVLYDDEGRVRYPNPAVPQFLHQWDSSALVASAQRREYELEDPAAAARQYARIAVSAPNETIAARAFLAQARCLAKAGKTDQARQVLRRLGDRGQYRDAMDKHGRLIVQNAQMLVLDLIADKSDGQFERTAAELTASLNDYRRIAMPSAQRRFLMSRLLKLLPARAVFGTLAAEEMAADYVASGAPPTDSGLLRQTAQEGIWQLATSTRRVVWLFRQDRLAAEMERVIEDKTTLAGATVKVLAPSAQAIGEEAFLSAPLGVPLWDWQVALYLTGDDPFASAAQRRIVVYLWIGGLSILAIGLGSVLVARFVSQQMKLAHLKNDLTATVSHELKTPLASMRVLVDTLLEGKVQERARVQEYFEMLSCENSRLSRLIDNFLAFSRMERNRQAFEFKQVRIGEVIDAAVESVGERFAGPECEFSVDVEQDLSTVWADADAMVTVLLNLLDNAYKYTGQAKRIEIRAGSGTNGMVALSVTDNGVGLSRRAARRVFDKFYQVDLSLSRDAGGCGLGLSIVKFIVKAHGGQIAVASQLGAGSTFTILLPAADSAAGARRVRRNGRNNGR